MTGIDRSQLEGVLTGMKVDYLDEEKALDEIAARIEKETGRRSRNPASWTRAKRRWLGIVGDLVAALPKPEVISKNEHDELKAKLSDTEAALADAESEITALKMTVERLKAAKDAAEVADILLPTNDIERFKALREAAVEALRKVMPVVQEAIRCHLVGDAMRWPDPMEDPGFAAAADEAVSEGFLLDTGNGLAPNNDHGPVKRASRAVGALADALRDDTFNPEFFERFQKVYDGPPELGQGAIWRSVFRDLSSRR